MAFHSLILPPLCNSWIIFDVDFTLRTTPASTRSGGRNTTITTPTCIKSRLFVGIDVQSCFPQTLRLEYCFYSFYSSCSAACPPPPTTSKNLNNHVHTHATSNHYFRHLYSGATQNGDRSIEVGIYVNGAGDALSAEQEQRARLFCYASMWPLADATIN